MEVKKRKKILYAITKSNWGGAQKYVYDLATNLPQDRFDVVVAHGGNGVLKTKLIEKNVRTISIEFLKRDIQLFGELANFFALLKILKNEKPDIVHLNSAKIGGLGTLAGRIMGIRKIIFTVHGWTFNETRNPLSRFVIKILSWITIMLSHTTITVSKNDFADAPQLFTSKKITTIHNGISNPVFKECQIARGEILSKINTKPILQNAVWVGTISELHTNKGLKYTIEAIKHFIDTEKEVLFFIIGEGEKRQPLLETIKRTGLEKQVFLLGHIDDAPSLLKAFDIFTLTSIKEGLPYVLLEAGMASLPVVASRVGGIPEIIEDKKSGLLVKPKNVEEIEKALLYLIENKEKRAQLGDMLEKKVREEFTFENMLNDTLQFYKKSNN